MCRAAAQQSRQEHALIPQTQAEAGETAAVGAAQIAQSLPPFVTRVALFRDAKPASVRATLAEVAIDASQVIWVATANDARGIPEPILNRMNVYEVQAPDRTAARHIAAKLYGSIRASHDWGSRFEAEPSSDVLDRMSDMAPREMRRAWMTAFGNAKLAKRDHIETQDLPATAGKRGAMGFVQ